MFNIAASLGLDKSNSVIAKSSAAKKLGIKTGITPADSWNQLIEGSYNLHYPRIVGEFRHMQDDFQITKLSISIISWLIPGIKKILTIFANIQGWKLAGMDTVHGFVRKSMAGITGGSVLDSISKEMDEQINTSISGLSAALGAGVSLNLNAPQAGINAAAGVSSNYLPDTSTNIDLTKVNPGNSMKMAESGGKTVSDFITASSQSAAGMERSYQQLVNEEKVQEIHEAIMEKTFGTSTKIPDPRPASDTLYHGYVHEQKNASRIWLIPNKISNLNSKYVGVTIFDTNWFKIEEDEFTIDDGYNVTISFDDDVAGTAVLFRLDDKFDFNAKAVKFVDLNPATKTEDQKKKEILDKMGPDISKLDLRDRDTVTKIQYDNLSKVKTEK